MKEFDKAGKLKSDYNPNAKTKQYKGGNFGGGKTNENNGYGDEGSAARFFYCSKPSKKEKEAGLENNFIINIDPLNFYMDPDYICKKQYIVWEKQDQKVMLQMDMERLQIKDTEEYGLKKEWLWNIDIFMNYITDRFQKDFGFIIETKTNSTITLKILNSWMLSIISDFIPVAKNEKMDGINNVRNADKLNMNESSTNQNKDGSNQNVKNVVSIDKLFTIKEQSKATHPTVKSIKLMSYLINMITPPNGIVLDPFMGSGSTGVAAIQNGFNFIGIEKEQEYMTIATKRIEYAKNNS